MTIIKFLLGLISVVGGGITFKNYIIIGKGTPECAKPVAYATAFAVFTFTCLSVATSGADIRTSIEALCSIHFLEPYCGVDVRPTQSRPDPQVGMTVPTPTSPPARPPERAMSPHEVRGVAKSLSWISRGFEVCKPKQDLSLTDIDTLRRGLISRNECAFNEGYANGKSDFDAYIGSGQECKIFKRDQSDREDILLRWAKALQRS